MRVLRVAQKVYPDVTGGGPYHVHALSRDQAEMGHNVTVLTVGEGTRREERDGYTVVRRPALMEPLGNAVAPGVARYLRRVGEFDVVHAHSHLYASTNLAALARRFSGTPLAITNHGLYSQTAPEWLFDYYLKTLGRVTFNSADVVFCYTREDRSRLRDRGVRTDVRVVPNGIDMDRFTPEGTRYTAIAGDPAVLFVGRLVSGKNPGDALAAFSEFHERYPDAVISFVGEGPLRGELERKAVELGVSDAVRFMGEVPYETMPSVYRAADVLVLPSRAEGFPRTVLESMASNVPVVVSDLDHVAPLVDRSGEVVPVGDVEALADSIEHVLDETAQRPRQAISEFEWQRAVERTTAILESVARQTGSTPSGPEHTNGRQ